MPATFPSAYSKSLIYKECLNGVATLAWGENIQIIKVHLTNLFLLYLWVFLCFRSGDTDNQSSVKRQATYLSGNPGHKCPNQANMVLRKQKGIPVWGCSK